MTTYYDKSITDVLKLLKTSNKGLTEREVRNRLAIYGLNEVKEIRKISKIKLFLSQFASFIIYILIGALIISLILGEILDSVVIGCILVLNALLGFIQEYRAEKAEALKKLASLKAKVLRDGKIKIIDSKLLVPGDIILLETGEKVPADCRLIETVNLETQEATLTGESLPVAKDIKPLPKDISLSERSNMVFNGTIITKGKGKAVVVKTGMQTELGKIAKIIQEPSPQTPLQIKLRKLGQVIGIATLVICAIIFFIGVIGGNNILEMFISAVSLAVAAIPEGLPAVVTINLALGVQRMAKRHALIRRLPAVEALGSVTVICTDKTGTLTCNEMTVKKLYVNDKIVEVTGSGYSTKGTFLYNKKLIDPKEFEMLLKIGVLCNDANLSNKIGDPTELALLVCAEKAGIKKSLLEKSSPRIKELSFDSNRKRMSTFNKIENNFYVRPYRKCYGPPRKSNENIITMNMGLNIILIGMLITVAWGWIIITTFIIFVIGIIANKLIMVVTKQPDR